MSLGGKKNGSQYFTADKSQFPIEEIRKQGRCSEILRLSISYKNSGSIMRKLNTDETTNFNTLAQEIYACATKLERFEILMPDITHIQQIRDNETLKAVEIVVRNRNLIEYTLSALRDKNYEYLKIRDLDSNGIIITKPEKKMYCMSMLRKALI